MSEPRLRLARADEIDRIRAIEDQAGTRYATVGLPDDLEGLPPETLSAAIEAGLLLVAVDPDDAPIGFALSQRFPSALHLRELDVLPAHQGRGLGRALIDATRAKARALGLPRVTLTTFRDVPFNAPFYARVGFAVLDALPDWLAEIRAREAREGLDRWPRVAMTIDS